MIKNKCLVCGSFNLRADRALSGRLICTSCGNPYGVRKIGSKKSFDNNISFINIKNSLFIFLLIFVVILVVI